MLITTGFKRRGLTKAMVGLQGLHSSDAFQHLNMLTSVGLKSFCPWCLKFGGNTKTIATHLREVHYRLAIVCDHLSIICQHVSAGGPGTPIKVAGLSHIRSPSQGSEKSCPKNSGESGWVVQST